jgi:hypothetical protein
MKSILLFSIAIALSSAYHISGVIESETSDHLMLNG